MKNQAQQKATSAAANERVRVLFPSEDGPAGGDDIFVSVNGRAYLIQREQEVSLPREVLEVFENAQQTVFEAGAGGHIRPRTVKRFSYSVRGGADARA